MVVASPAAAKSPGYAEGLYEFRAAILPLNATSDIIFTTGHGSKIARNNTLILQRFA